MFKKLYYRLAIINSLSKFSFGVRKFFFLLCITGGASMLISLIIPKFYEIFVDQVIVGRNYDAFKSVLIGYLGAFAVNTILSYLRNYSTNKLSNRVVFRIKYKLLKGYLNFTLDEYERRDIGDLKMRIDDDVSKLSDFGGVQTIDYLVSLVTAAVAAVIAFCIEWRLAVFSITIIPITFYIDYKISCKEKELQNINRENDQSRNSWLHSSIQGWKEVKALNLEKHQLRTFTRYVHNFAEYFGRWINFWVARVLVIPKIKDEFLMKFALYFFGGLLIMNNEMTIGELLVFALYYDILSRSIHIVSAADADMQSNMPFYDRVIDELNAAAKPAFKYLVPEGTSSDICVSNVKFSYDKSLPPVLENFSMNIRQGERVAIVGRSGFGKTTLLKLIGGLLLPESGQVLFSGIDINRINPNYLYGRMGFVLQDNLLFNTTIYENLRLACPHADLDMMDEACKRACIYDFIYDQPQKYDTIIGEKGIKLSGGQRQRLILARLFIRDVDVWIFDEATSAIDQYSESIIHDTISSIGRNKTVIVVAHRESSIGLCDRVVNLTP